jgi:hypothetical protein
MSTPKQRQELGYMRKLIGLDEDTYRDILSQYGASSSKDLTGTQIYELINKFRDTAKQMGVFKPKKSFNHCKYNNLAGRAKMASPAQLRKIEAMWMQISRQKTDIEKAKALKSFIKRITGKDGISFITSVDARKLINAMENM